MTDVTELTERQTQIKDEFIRRRGYWADDWQIILGLDAEYLAAYTDLSSYAIEHGGLDIRTRELIYVATCASVTHQHPVGIRQHGRNALAHGATPEQLLAVFELVSTLGVATVQLAVEKLEELEPGTVDAIARAEGTTDEQVSALVDRFTEVNSAWDPNLELTLRAVPGFYSAVLELQAVPRLASTVLTPKEIALISLSVNALVTHLDGPALKRDIVAARRAGATPAEILDVCEQIAGIGVHAITIGVPILVELMAERADQA